MATGTRTRTRLRMVKADDGDGRADIGRTGVVKALLLGLDEPRSKGAGEDLYLGVFNEAGAIEPPYDPLELIKWFELSAALRPNVDAYVTNIESFGHRLVPSIDLTAEDIDDQIADILYLRRLAETGGSPVGGDDALEPTPEEVDAEKERLKRLARRERARLDAFFAACCAETSFVRLRRRTRTDVEVTANGYWEVLRNRAGQPARFKYMPSALTRLLPLDPEFVEVTEFEHVTPVDYEPVTVRRQMRRYVQLEEVSRVPTYFKEFGDPRTISAETGNIYESPEALAEAEPGAKAATEVIHFKIDWPSSPYGVPRWVGCYPEVGGSRAASEVNYLYFDNKAVPPLAMLISGGRLASGAHARIENFITERLKGRQNFNKILLVEATSDGKSSSAARVELVPLNDANQKDGLFQSYDQRNIDKIGAAFRLPKLLRGDSSDVTRANADAALRLAEEQVFAPERADFDWFINAKLLPAMGIRFWRFQSLTPITKDPERLGKLIAMLVSAGVLLPQEARRLAVDVFNVELPDIKEPWAKRPIPLVLAGIQTGGEVDGSGRGGSTAGAPGDDVDPALVQQAKSLLGLAERLKAEKAALDQRRLAMAREQAAAAGPETVLGVPAEEFRSWWAPAEEAS